MLYRDLCLRKFCNSLSLVFNCYVSYGQPRELYGHLSPDNPSNLKLMKYIISVQTLAKGSAIFYGSITRFVLRVVSLSFLAHTILVYARIGHVIQIKVRAKRNQRGADERMKLLQYLSEIKAAKTGFLIAICWIVCNLPIIITFSGMLSIKSFFTDTILRRYFVALASLNSILNPVILFWNNKRLRIHVYEDR